jgi:GT2 family glycosyltransferase
MNISFVLAVYNNLELTKNCYQRIRSLYPTAEIVITSAGSTDGTNEWLDGLNDDHLIFRYLKYKVSFGRNYNMGIELVTNPKLVLIHNDMIIGKNFLETLNKHLTEDIILSYTTIEPPIFEGHERPGKVIRDYGNSFEDFKYNEFDYYIDQVETNITKGASFFMSGYKQSFIKIGMFDGLTFDPCFCEDDDILYRFYLNGFKLKTISSAVVYHFVSRTSRFSEEIKNKTAYYEMTSNSKFKNKWGFTTVQLNNSKYWEK